MARLRYRLACILGFLVSCGLPTQNDYTDFWLNNHCTTPIILKSTAVVLYSSGPRDEYREFTVKAGELFFLRDVGLSESSQMTDVFKTFDIYSGAAKSTCAWSSRSDWEFSEPEGKKRYTYHVYPTCF